MNQQPTGSLSPWKRIVGLFALLVVVAVCGGVPLLLRANGNNDAASPAPAATPDIAAVIAFYALGLLTLFAGAATYGLVLLTHCFTFDFSRPFFDAFKVRLWFANLVVTLLLQAGVAFMTGVWLVPLARNLLPPAAAVPAAFFAPFIAAQFLLVWLQLWAPLETSVARRRLTALGITGDQLAAGRCVGISDPTKNSFKKLSLVEDDLGMLWFDPHRLVYRGDSRAFDVAPHELQRVERKADAGSTSSYFGAVHVILHVHPAAGAPFAVRLHPEGRWTMTAKARELRDLAERLESWHATAAPSPTPA